MRRRLCLLRMKLPRSLPSEKTFLKIIRLLRPCHRKLRAFHLLSFSRHLFRGQPAATTSVNFLRNAVFRIPPADRMHVMRIAVCRKRRHNRRRCQFPSQTLLPFETSSTMSSGSLQTSRPVVGRHGLLLPREEPVTNLRASWEAMPIAKHENCTASLQDFPACAAWVIEKRHKTQDTRKIYSSYVLHLESYVSLSHHTDDLLEIRRGVQPLCDARLSCPIVDEDERRRDKNLPLHLSIALIQDHIISLGAVIQA